MGSRRSVGILEPFKAVIFDYGNVLSYPDHHESAGRMARICGLGIQEFQRRYLLHRPDYDRGSVDGKEYWRRVVERTTLSLNDARVDALIEEDTRNTTDLNPDMLEWAGILADQGYKLAILSNMTVDDLRLIKGERIQSKLRAFSPTLFSGERGLVKPEIEFYLVCLRELGLRPGQALFIDDRIENTRTASGLGMPVFLFESYEKSLPILVRRFGLPGARKPA